MGLNVGGATKRLIDVVGAVLGLVLLSPVLVALAIGVRIMHGAPVLFRQERAGLHGRPFRIVKLRTMTDARGPDGVLLPDVDRLTAFGRFLRSSSLDELPELWNVLVGDMSLVGPRPLPTAYLPRYTPRESRRHDVRPGITGLAQASGRNTLSWEGRLELDVVYVETRSTVGDVRLILRTLRQVIAREGITAEGHATMHELRPPGADESGPA
jgi:lipopolysaccharide/colanic/teichoic acid biosynthesis glycosyltransferase